MSSSIITDTRQLPIPCNCSLHDKQYTYEQLLRLRRTCLSSITVFDISEIMIDVAGTGYSSGDTLQLYGVSTTSPSLFL